MAQQGVETGLVDPGQHATRTQRGGRGLRGRASSRLARDRIGGQLAGLDVEAALDYTLAQPGVQRVGAWGGSMGGAAVLEAAAGVGG